MNLHLHRILAWVSLIVILLLCALYAANRKVKLDPHNESLTAMRRVLYRYHKVIGILIIFIVFIHGKTSGKRPDAIALLSLLLLILLPLSYLLKKKLPNGWIIIHRILTIILLLLIVIHIILAKLS